MLFWSVDLWLGQAIFVPSTLIALPELSLLSSGKGIIIGTFAVADQVSPAAKLGFGTLAAAFMLIARWLLPVRGVFAVASDMLLALMAMLLVLVTPPEKWSRGFGIGFTGTRCAPAAALIYSVGALLSGPVFSLAETKCSARAGNATGPHPRQLSHLEPSDVQSTRLFRWATAADYDVLADIMFDAVRNGRSRYTEQQRAAWVPVRRSGKDWVARLQAQDVVVAEHDGRAIGFASLAEGGYVDFTHIRPEAQQTGLFRQLLSVITERANAKGELLLWTHASLMAEPAFAKLGFTIRRRERVHIGNQAFDRCEMEKLLPPR